jgi:hypothetical protein
MGSRFVERVLSVIDSLMGGYSSASWAIGELFSDCITKDIPPPFNLPSTTFGYTPAPPATGE